MIPFSKLLTFIPTSTMRKHARLIIGIVTIVIFALAIFSRPQPSAAEAAQDWLTRNEAKIQQAKELLEEEAKHREVLKVFNVEELSF